jgi:hypothetical protein
MQSVRESLHRAARFIILAKAYRAFSGLDTVTDPIFCDDLGIALIANTKLWHGNRVQHCDQPGSTSTTTPGSIPTSCYSGCWRTCPCTPDERGDHGAYTASLPSSLRLQPA